MQKIAIVGSGISGISAAYLLKDRYKVTLFEAGSYFGGHTNTIDITVSGKKFPVDTGFIVFNQHTYPNLIKFFEELEVKSYESDMSFGASVRGGEIEYCTSSVGQFFAQKKNLYNPRFARMSLDILRFIRHASHIELGNLLDITLDEYIAILGLSDGFKQDYLYPMAGAVWSTPTSKIGSFPALAFIQFFRNHGLLKIWDHPKWYTVENGSRTYVKLALKSRKIKKIKDCAIIAAVRSKQGVELTTQNGEKLNFDQVIFATPASKTLEILRYKSSIEHEVLSTFHYSHNTAYLHSDESLLPKSRKAWASWNFFDTSSHTVGVTYWMNKLQKLPTATNVFVTLNPEKPPSQDLTYQTLTYQHPMYDLATIKAQLKIQSLQGRNHTWFCGSYQRYGFHEDGIWSALRVVNQLGVKASWQ